ncbi:MAG: zinc-ribbon domain-containing protein [Alphaproteobacteria bacterium]|nr:zinc-ribbon domain-containing protein [Alphaproteobacteria bacterium]
MIITCPTCAKRYMLDDNLLPREGRQVRCVACQHIWFQAPLEEIFPVLSLQETGDIFIEPRTSFEKKSSWKFWFFSFSFLLLGVCFLSFGREHVVTYWPQAEKLYNLIGLRITHPGADLSIFNTSSLLHREGSEEILQISGDIINNSNQVRQIPPLKVKLLGNFSHPNCKEQSGKECVLDSWNHRLSENSLLPGEKIHFETEAHPKASGTHRISVEF